MPLKSYKICSKIFEHGFDPPPPFWTTLKKTADLGDEGTPKNLTVSYYSIPGKGPWLKCINLELTFLTSGVAAVAVVASAAYVASSSSSSSSGVSQTFWSANGPILAVGAGVVAVVGLAYYLANRTTVHRRAETMAASKWLNLNDEIEKLQYEVFRDICSVCLKHGQDNEQGWGCVGRGDQDGRQSWCGWESWPGSRKQSLYKVNSSEQLLGSRGLTLEVYNAWPIFRMGAVFMQNYLDYYNSLIPSTKFSSRLVR